MTKIINSILVKLLKIKVIQPKEINCTLQLLTVIVTKQIIKKKDIKDKKRRKRNQESLMKGMKLKNRIFFKF